MRLFNEKMTDILTPVVRHTTFLNKIFANTHVVAI